jgi:hypothetical protein
MTLLVCFLLPAAGVELWFLEKLMGGSLLGTIGVLLPDETLDARHDQGF